MLSIEDIYCAKLDGFIRKVTDRYVSRSWYGSTANAQSSFSLHALNYITKLPPPTTINCVFATLT